MYTCVYMWVVYVIFIIHNFAACITQQAPTRVQIIGVASVYSDCVPVVIHFFSPAGCSSPPTLYSALLLCTSMRAPFTIVGVDMKFRGQRLDRAEEAHPAKKKQKNNKKSKKNESSADCRREAGTNDGKREREGRTSFRIYRRAVLESYRLRARGSWIFAATAGIKNVNAIGRIHSEINFDFLFSVPPFA